MSTSLKAILALIITIVVVGVVFYVQKGEVAKDGIVLGAAVSLTGKYSTNGAHTKNGYDLAVKLINGRGGVKVGDKSYMLSVKYYDDESTPARGAQLAERLIKQDKVNFMLGP